MIVGDFEPSIGPLSAEMLKVRMEGEDRAGRHTFAAGLLRR